MKTPAISTTPAPIQAVTAIERPHGNQSFARVLAHCSTGEDTRDQPQAHTPARAEPREDVANESTARVDYESDDLDIVELHTTDENPPGTTQSDATPIGAGSIDRERADANDARTTDVAVAAAILPTIAPAPAAPPRVPATGTDAETTPDGGLSIAADRGGRGEPHAAKPASIAATPIADAPSSVTSQLRANETTPASAVSAQTAAGPAGPSVEGRIVAAPVGDAARPHAIRSAGVRAAASPSTGRASAHATRSGGIATEAVPERHDDATPIEPTLATVAETEAVDGVPPPSAGPAVIEPPHADASAPTASEPTTANDPGSMRAAEPATATTPPSSIAADSPSSTLAAVTPAGAESPLPTTTTTTTREPSAARPPDAPVMLSRAEDLATAIERLRPIPRGGATLELDTPGMGAMRLHVRVEDGVVRVRIHATSPEAATWLAQERDGLTAAARSAVGSALGIELDLRGGSNDSQDRRPDQQSLAFAPTIHDPPATTVLPSAAPSQAAPVRARGLVDVLA